MQIKWAFLFSFFVWAHGQEVFVNSKIAHESGNYVAVDLVITNNTATSLNQLKVDYYINVLDMSEELKVKVDYSSKFLKPIVTNSLSNFLIEIPFVLDEPLDAHDSVNIQFRYYQSDWADFDKSNDPSYIPMMGNSNYISNYDVVVSDGDFLLSGHVPDDPVIDPSDYQIETISSISQQSNNTLGIVLKIRNTGTLPLRDLNVVYFANSLSYSQPIELNVDYSNIVGLTYKTMINQEGTTELIFELNDEVLSVNEEREIHFRYHLPNWSNIQSNLDFSFPISNQLKNDNILITQCNKILDGNAPYVINEPSDSEVDSDLDGVIDVIELALGYDPNDALSFPWVGIPDQLYINTDQDEIVVVYDYSHIPGFESSQKVLINYGQGLIEPGLVPLVEIVFESNTEGLNPPLGYYSLNFNTVVHADVSDGKDLTVPIPLLTNYSIQTKNAFKAFHYNNDLATWSSLPNSDYYNYQGVIPVVSNTFSPVSITRQYFLQQVSAKSEHVLWVYNQDEGTSGRVLAMGNNEFGQLGNGTQKTTDLESEQTTLTPQWVIGLDNAIFVAAGSDHSLAIDKDYKVWSWGNNSYGQLGVPGFGQSSEPINVELPEDIIFIGAGNGTSFAIGVNGDAYVWGKNDKGQLGLGDLNQRDTPVLHPNKFIEIQGGTDHTVAIGVDQKIYSWGDNNEGQLGLFDIDGLWVLGGNKTLPQPVNHNGELTPRVNLKSVDFGIVSFTQNNLSVNGDRFAMTRRVNNNAKSSSLPFELEGGRDCLGTTPLGIAQGAEHCVVKLITQGSGTKQLYLTGNNEYRQLGTGNVNSTFENLTVEDASVLTDIAAGNTSTFHRRIDGSLFMTGLLDGYQTADEGEVFEPDLDDPEISIDPLTTNAESPALGGSVSEKVNAFFKVGSYEFEKVLEGQWALVDELAGIAEGTYDVEVEIVDEGANRYNEVFSQALVVDRTAPVITILSPLSHQNLGQISSYMVEYKVLENGIESLEQETVSIDPIINGFYSIEIFSTDLAGNIGSSTVEIIVGDITSKVMVDFEEKFTLDPNFIVTGTSLKADEVLVYLDETLVCQLTSSLETWSCPMQSMATGIHTIKAIAQNQFGSSDQKAASLNHELSELNIVSMGVLGSPEVRSQIFDLNINLSIPASAEIIIWKLSDQTEVFRKSLTGVAGDNVVGINQDEIEVNLDKGLYGITVEAKTVGVEMKSLAANISEYVKTHTISVNKNWDELPHYELNLNCLTSKLFMVKAKKNSATVTLMSPSLCSNGVGEEILYLTNLNESGVAQNLPGQSFELEIYEATSSQGIFEIKSPKTFANIEANFRTINPYFNEVYEQEFEMLGSYSVDLKVYQDFIAESQLLIDFDETPVLNAGEVYNNFAYSHEVEWLDELGMAMVKYEGHLVFVYEIIDAQGLVVDQVVRAVEVSGE